MAITLLQIPVLIEATVNNQHMHITKMGKGKELKEEERAFIVGMSRGGASISKIAEETKRPRGTIATILRKFRLRGNVQTAKRSGRPPKTTPRDHRHLEKLVKDDRRASAIKLTRKWEESIQKSVSVRTTRRRLNALGYNGRQARKKPYISAKNKKKRMEWAREMKEKTMTYWKKVVFTDESKIKISGSDGRVFVWRKSTEEWLPCCTLGTVKMGGASIMVWGSMSYDGVGPLITVQGSVTGRVYRDILENNFLPLVTDRRRRRIHTILQDDNAPIHRANVVKSWKTKNKIRSLEWPAQSPDLNPIENMWMVLKKAISARDPPPRTVADLQVVVREEWEKIKKKLFRHW